MKLKVKGSKTITGTIVWGVVSTALIGAFSAGCVIANKWSRPLTSFFGTIGSSSAEGSNFAADNKTQEDIDAKAQEIASDIIKEGTVLLKNDGVLPLAKNNEVSVFGVTSTYWVKTETINGQANNLLWNSLEEVGLKVNKELRSFYRKNTPKYGGGGTMGDGSSFTNWKIDETPISKYDSVVSTYENYHDAAIVVLSRGGSEGADTPTNMDNQGGTSSDTYMSLSQNEKDLLAHVTSKFPKTIVVINSPAGLDMSFVKEYPINSVIWLAGTGDSEISSLGKLLVGDFDFSGRSVDTYVYNNKASNPAIQNFGDFRFVDSNDNLVNYSYVNYAEGIYVGYKYYESRYEDNVLNTNNVGDFDYSNVVAYPFGHGLSYNTYSWSNMQISSPDENDDITVSLTVKNDGNIPGKDVVEIYYQAPYTDYDKTKKIEKSSVNLAGFAKTKELKPGEEETVSVAFNKFEMASWDKTYSHDNVKGAYLYDEGDYYIAAGRNAHDAVNNILANEGIVEGDKSFSKKLTLSQKEYVSKTKEGKLYQNNFSDSYLEDATYLTRSDWSQIERGLTYQNGSKSGVSHVSGKDGNAYTHTISDALLSKLKTVGWDAAGNPNALDSYPEIKLGAKNDINFYAMKGIAYDDEKWNALLENLTLDELNDLFSNGGYGTVALNSISKPETKEYDGPMRILNMFTHETTFVYPTEVLMAATWNRELLNEFGSCMGDQCIKDRISGWYAPAMNIHRTAFGGRAFEYYSEDPLLSGKMASSAVEGVQKKGVYAYIKHFAMNEQETNRSSNGNYSSFADEQTIRETYLKPFQIAIEEGGAKGVMASMNRIGTRQAMSHYGLLTSILRNEWSFQGVVITDYVTGLSSTELEGCLAAGLDLQLNTNTSQILSKESLQKPGIQARLKEAAHHILYTQANSLAIDNQGFGTPIYVILLAVAGLVIGIYIALAGYLTIKYGFFKEKEAGLIKFVKMSKADTIIAIMALAILIGLLTYALVWFFKVAYPMLKLAFQI